mgnify:CR=1 FL=1
MSVPAVSKDLVAWNSVAATAQTTGGVALLPTESPRVGITASDDRVTPAKAVGAAAPVREIVSAIPGIDLDANQWPYIGAKAGNLPGDLTFSWYAEDRSGQAWVVSFQLNWPRFHGSNAAGWLLSIAKQVFAILPQTH